MGMIERLEHRAEHDTWPPSDTDNFWYDPVGAQAIGSSIRVTPDSSMGLTPVWRAVNLLSASVGILPCKTYRERPGGGKDLQRDHPAYNLLRWQPNGFQNAMEFFAWQQAHILLRGNAFSHILRDSIGVPTALVPWHPDRVKIRIEGSRLIYKLQRGGTKGPLLAAQEDMLHVRGLGGDGVVGWSPIAATADTISAGFASRLYGARFFENDSRPGGVLMHPGKLDDSDRQNIEKSWAAAYGGAGKHGTALLEKGLKFETISVTNEEAQFLETMKFNVVDIARIFGVPPHMLMELDRATFSNIDEQTKEFATYSIQPWLVRWEQEIRAKLFAGEDGVFAEFLMEALLRSDTKGRAEANAIKLQNGVLNQDEWRAQDNQNPLPNGLGSKYWMPLNFQLIDDAVEGLPPAPVDKPPDGDDDGDDGDGEEESSLDNAYLLRAGVKPATAQALPRAQVRSVAGRHRAMRSFLRIFADAAGRVVRREVAEVRRLVVTTKGEAQPLRQRLDEFYDGFAPVVSRALLPVLQAYGEQVFNMAMAEVGDDTPFGTDQEQFVRDYADNAAKRHVFSSQGQLNALMAEAETDEERAAMLEGRLGEWQEKRGDKMAAREAVQMNGAISKLAYLAAAVVLIRWIAIGENCPLCNAMDGRVVGVEENFLGAGDTVQAAGAAPLSPRRPVGHPPLHEGCDCIVAASS